MTPAPDSSQDIFAALFANVPSKAVTPTGPAAPTIGRVVHYVLADGQHRPATVVNHFGGMRANLTVQLDGLNDLQPAYYADADGTMTANPGAGICKKHLVPVGGYGFIPGVLSVGSADYDETGEKPGSWHYPERA